jgi:hypothetical protein
LGRAVAAAVVAAAAAPWPAMRHVICGLLLVVWWVMLSTNGCPGSIAPYMVQGQRSHPA